MLISGNIEQSFGQINLNFSGLKLNSFELTEPIYQATTGYFQSAKYLATKPFKIAEESFFEAGIMKNIGNVTNNMTFTNTYLNAGTIQAGGKGTIKTEDGDAINWISSDIGTIKSNNIFFNGIILFNNTRSENLSFLNNALGVYKDSPGIKRTIWLIK